MTRGERLAWGGALSPVIPLRADASGAPRAPRAAPLEVAPVAAAAGELRAELAAEVGPAVAAAAGELRAELTAEVGPAAAALPLDLVDVVAYAWRAFRRGRDP
jgi:hypothetical protein